jgi:hypothetical protein
MRREELSIGLLRDKLKEFGDVDYALDHKVTEEYVLEPAEQIEKVNEEISREEKVREFYNHLARSYNYFRFLDFLYYLAPFALVFGVIALFFWNRGLLLLLLPFLAAGKFLLGQFFLFQVNKKTSKITSLTKERQALMVEKDKRLLERESLLSRASILAAEIRYLEHFLASKD